MLIFRKRNKDGTFCKKEPSMILADGHRKSIEKALLWLFSKEESVLVCGDSATVMFLLAVLHTNVPVRIENEYGKVIVEHMLTVEEAVQRWIDPSLGLTAESVSKILEDPLIPTHIKTLVRTRTKGKVKPARKIKKEVSSNDEEWFRRQMDSLYNEGNGKGYLS